MQKRFPTAFTTALLAGTLAIATVAPAAAQVMPAKDAPAMPKVGDVAPDFSLNYFDGSDLKDVSLSQYRGKKNVVVAFFVFAFTGG